MNRTVRHRAWVRAAWTISLLAGVVGSAALAQPERGTGKGAERQAQPDQPPSPISKEDVADLIARRTAELDRRKNRLTMALERLQGGADPADVLAEIDPRRAGGAPARGRGAQGQPKGAAPRERPAGNAEPPGGPPDAEPVAPADRERLMAFMSEHLPKVAERMKLLGEKNPAVLDRLLARMKPRLIDLRSSRGDEELFKLRVIEIEGGVRVMDAVRDYQAALKTQDGLDGAKAELRSALETQFETKQSISRREIGQLEERLSKLRASVAERDADRGRLIDQQIREAETRPIPLGIPKLDRRPDPGAPQPPRR